MPVLDLNFYTKNAFWIGMFAFIVAVLAWTAELSGAVYICPYCRVQRTVIGLLGIVLMTPLSRVWYTQFLAVVVGFFGAVVAANQHFMGWKKISAGAFGFKDNLLIDPFILSGLAMIFILFQVFLLIKPKTK